MLGGWCLSRPLPRARRAGADTAATAAVVAELLGRLLHGIAIAASADLDTGATLVVDAGSHAFSGRGSFAFHQPGTGVAARGTDHRSLTASGGRSTTLAQA
jgi:hypothetical protein